VAIRVVLWGAVAAELASGTKEFEIEARNVRGVINAMNELIPGLGPILEEETTIAIDGEIYDTTYFQRLEDGCELYFLPKIEAG
jgi:sulfur-carrier protein